MLFGPLPPWTWIDTQRGEKGKKKTEKEKKNVTRQIKEKNKGGCLRYLKIYMYKYIFSMRNDNLT